jgi:hypothetical protein
VSPLPPAACASDYLDGAPSNALTGAQLAGLRQAVIDSRDAAEAAGAAAAIDGVLALFDNRRKRLAGFMGTLQPQNGALAADGRLIVPKELMPLVAATAAVQQYCEPRLRADGQLSISVVVDALRNRGLHVSGNAIGAMSPAFVGAVLLGNTVDRDLFIYRSIA